MAIRFTCACGRELEVLDDLAGQPYTCRSCGAKLTVPAGGGAAAAPGAPAGVPAATKPCFMCRSPVSGSDAWCRSCGWDGVHGRRCCVLCGGWMVYDYGTAVRPLETSLAGPAGAAIGEKLGLFGFSGAMAIGCALSSLLCLVGGFGLRYRCKKCGTEGRPSLFSEAEKRDLHGHRTLLFLGTGFWAVLAVVFGAVWIFFVSRQIDERRYTSPEAIARLEAGGAAAVPDLIEALQFDSVGGRAYHALRKVGPPAVPALAAALSHKQRDVRRGVAWVLRDLGPDAAPAVPALTAALADADEYVREDAARALGAIGPAAASAIPALQKAADDPSGSVRMTADEAIKKIGQ